MIGLVPNLVNYILFKIIQAQFKFAETVFNRCAHSRQNFFYFWRNRSSK